MHPGPPPAAASEKLTALLASLRESLTVLSRSVSTTTTAAMNARSQLSTKTPDGEIERLQGIIDALRVEIDEAHKQSAAHAEQTQALFDQLQQDQPMPIMHKRESPQQDDRELSLDLMITPAKDEERDRIEAIKKGLEEERKRFTEAAVKLGRERATLEAERVQFLDEKRSWQVELMLAELPPTPAPPTTTTDELSTSPARPKKNHTAAAVPDFSEYQQSVFRKSPPRKSPRKSPVKPTVVGKAGTSRKTRVLRRSSSGLGLGVAERLELSYETEVMPPPAFPVNIGTLTSTMSQSLLPTTFVLPPPSPHSSLPRAPASLLSAAIPAAAMLPPAFTLNLPASFPQPSTSNNSAPPPPIFSAPPEIQKQQPSPTTPLRRPFPVAKPLATRMIHAYSPARPSPLSRILMLNDSPADSPNYGSSLGDLAEDEETSPTPTTPLTVANANRPISNSLAAEVVMEESPLKEKKVESNVDVTGKSKMKAVVAEAKRFTAKEKGKGKADVLPATATAARSRTTVEKENQVKPKSSKITSSSYVGPVSSVANTRTKVAAVAADGKKVTKPVAKPTSVAGTGTTTRIGVIRMGPGRGGPRRVPIDSAEAASVGPGWRG